MVMPGDNLNMEVDLLAPIAMDKGQRFAIREGGKTVGSGVVSQVIEGTPKRKPAKNVKPVKEKGGDQAPPKADAKPKDKKAK